MSRSYTSSPPSAFMACSGTALSLPLQYLAHIILVFSVYTVANVAFPNTVFCYLMCITEGDGR
jgi:hypothetical protein